ncbi:MAG TPA: hypothetical protein VIE65_17710 [Methylobacter sp.]|jgi:hypothetical protein
MSAAQKAAGESKKLLGVKELRAGGQEVSKVNTSLSPYWLGFRVHPHGMRLTPQ